MGEGSRPKYQHMLSVVQIAEGHPQLVPPLGDNIDHAQLHNLIQGSFESMS